MRIHAIYVQIYELTVLCVFQAAELGRSQKEVTLVNSTCR